MRLGALDDFEHRRLEGPVRLGLDLDDLAHQVRRLEILSRVDFRLGSSCPSSMCSKS